MPRLQGPRSLQRPPQSCIGRGSSRSAPLSPPAERRICDSSAHRRRKHARESSTLSAASALCSRGRTSRRTPPSVRWRLASARDRLMSAESMVGHTSTNLQSEGVQSEGHTYAISCTSFMNNEHSRVSAAHKSCVPRKTHYASQHCFQLTAVGGDSGSTVASYCLWNRGLCARCAPERGACHPAWANEAEGHCPPPLAGVSVDPFEPDRGCAQQCMQPRVSKLASVFVWSRSETLFSLRNVAWYSGLDRAVWVFSGSAVAASGTHACCRRRDLSWSEHVALLIR